MTERLAPARGQRRGRGAGGAAAGVGGSVPGAEGRGPPLTVAAVVKSVRPVKPEACGCHGRGPGDRCGAGLGGRCAGVPGRRRRQALAGGGRRQAGAGRRGGRGREVDVRFAAVHECPEWTVPGGGEPGRRGGGEDGGLRRGGQAPGMAARGGTAGAGGDRERRHGTVLDRGRRDRGSPAVPGSLFPDGNREHVGGGRPDVGDPVGQRPALGDEGSGRAVRGPGDRRERPAGGRRAGDVLRPGGASEELPGFRRGRRNGVRQDGRGRHGVEPEAGADRGGRVRGPVRGTAGLEDGSSIAFEGSCLC